MLKMFPLNTVTSKTYLKHIFGRVTKKYHLFAFETEQIF